MRMKGALNIAKAQSFWFQIKSNLKKQDGKREEANHPQKLTNYGAHQNKISGSEIILTGLSGTTMN